MKKRMKSLARNSVYNVIYQALNVVFPLITSMYVSRILLEDGVGKVAYAQNIASYFSTVAILGLPTYGIREIALESERKGRSKVFTELFTINAISTTAALAAYGVALFWITGAREELPLYVCAGLSILLNYANIDWLYQGQEEYGYITARSFAVKVLSVAALFCFVRQKDDYVVYAVITNLGTACNYLFNIFHAKKYVDFTFHGLKLKRHLQPVLVLALASFLGTIYNRIDVTMLGIMADDAAVGYYTNAHKIVLLAASCCTAISTVFMPRLSYYYTNDKAALRRLVHSGTQILLTLSVPAAVGLALVAEDAILLLYGESFRPAGMTLAIFSPLLVILSVGDLLCYQLLISAGQEKKRVYASAMAAVVNVALNAAWIPRWQQNGAALASVLSEMLVNGLLLYFAYRVVNVRLQAAFAAKIAGATIGMAGVVLVTERLIPSLAVSVPCSVAVGLAVYLLLSCTLKNEVVLLWRTKAQEMARRLHL